MSAYVYKTCEEKFGVCKWSFCCLDQKVKYRRRDSVCLHFALHWVEFVFFSSPGAQAVVNVGRHTAPGEMPKMSASIEAK